ALRVGARLLRNALCAAPAAYQHPRHGPLRGLCVRARSVRGHVRALVRRSPALGAPLDLPVQIAAGEARDAACCLAKQLVRLAKADTDVAARRLAKATARHHGDLLAVEQAPREGLVVRLHG